MTQQRISLSGLTAIDLAGLTRLELAFALILAAAASGLVLALGLAERRRTFAIASALGARRRQLGAFVWSEAAFVAVCGTVLGSLAGWGIAQVIVKKILTGVFDPPPTHLSVPWAYFASALRRWERSSRPASQRSAQRVGRSSSSSATSDRDRESLGSPPTLPSQLPSCSQPPLASAAPEERRQSPEPPSPSALPSSSSSPMPVRPAVLQISVAPYRLDAPVQREVAVSDGTTVYLAGGLDVSDTSASGVFALDPTTGRLRQIGSVPSAFHDAAGAMIGGKVFIFGGGAAAGSNLVQTFDPATGTATVAGHLPVALSDLSAATVGDTVYLVGGYDGQVPRREIYATTDGATFRVAGRLPVGLRYARSRRSVQCS